MMKIDLHSHTSASYDAFLPPAWLPSLCRWFGIDCVAITDHNLIADSTWALSKQPYPRIIVGEEIETSEGEIIGLFLRKTIPARQSLLATVEEIHRQGGLVYLGHAFDTGRDASITAEALISIKSQVDIVEVWNARTRSATARAQAKILGEQMGCPVAASSDAHSLFELGRACVDVPAFEGPQQLLVALRAGRLMCHSVSFIERVFFNRFVRKGLRSLYLE